MTVNIDEKDIQSINSLCKEAARIAEEHGFKENTVGEDIALMHSELSEALEDYRKGRAPNEVIYEDAIIGMGTITTEPFSQVKGGEAKRNKPCGIPSELADTVIRIMHFSHRHGIDLGKAIAEKMVFNETRPFKHARVHQRDERLQAIHTRRIHRSSQST